MEVLEQEPKNCRITAARTNLPFIIFSTFLADQDQLFHFSGTGKAGKEETGVFPVKTRAIASGCGSGYDTSFVMLWGYQLQVGVSV